MCTEKGQNESNKKMLFVYGVVEKYSYRQYLCHDACKHN